MQESSSLFITSFSLEFPPVPRPVSAACSPPQSATQQLPKKESGAHTLALSRASPLDAALQTIVSLQKPASGATLEAQPWLEGTFRG